MFVWQLASIPSRCFVLPPYVRLALKSLIAEPRPLASVFWKFFDGVSEIAIRQLEPKLLMALGKLSKSAARAEELEAMSEFEH